MVQYISWHQPVVTHFMSSYLPHKIGYNETLFTGAPDVDMTGLEAEEQWSERPASPWAVQRIGVLVSKIEKHTYQIFHNPRYGKHNLSRLIPGHLLRRIANESFGYDGWKMEVLEVEAQERPTSHPGGTNSEDGTAYTVLAEARVKITLKDGTNTQASGFGYATLGSKGQSFGKAQKEACNDAFKKAILEFETIIMEHGIKVENKYYVDGLYASEAKKEKK